MRPGPRLIIDTDAITARTAGLAGFGTCPECAFPAAQAVTDITALLAQVHGLYAALLRTRLDAANLRAAICAALGAAEDGESDPLGYLRDELPAHGQLPGEYGEGWCP